MSLTLILTLSIVSTVLSLAVWLVPPTGLVALAMLAWSLNMMPIPTGLGPLGIVGAAIALILACVRSAGLHSGHRRTAPVAFWPLLAGGLGLLTIPWAYSPTSSLVASLEMMLMGVLTLLAAFYLRGPTVVKGAFIGLFPLVLTSVFWDIPSGEQVIDVTRHSGLTDNPNSLALLAGVWACLAFGVGKRAVVVAIPLATVVMFLAGSRGSTLALVGATAAACWIWLGDQTLAKSGRRILGRAAVVAVLAAGSLGAWALWLRLGNLGSGSGIARTGDSDRILALAYNWQLVHERPVTGFGFGFTPREGFGAGLAAHLFPLSLWVELGVLALIALVALLLMLVRTNWRRSPFLAAATTFALISMATESWLTGAGAVWTLVFWLSVATWDTDVRSQPQLAERHVSAGVSTAGSRRTDLRASFRRSSGEAMPRAWGP